jgi:hypothetical protein
MNRQLLQLSIALVASLWLLCSSADAQETNSSQMIQRTVPHSLAAVQKAVESYFATSPLKRSETLLPWKTTGGVYRCTFFNCSTRFPGGELTAKEASPKETLIQIRIMNPSPEAIKEQTQYIQRHVLPGVIAVLNKKS